MESLAIITKDTLEVVPTKKEVAEATNRIVSIVDEGYTDPLKALAFVSAMADVFTEAKKALTPIAITEAEKYTEKTISHGGAEFQLKEGGVKYDYSMDAEWCQLKEQADGINALLKGRETTLKNMQKSAKDGEVYCTKTSTTTLSVTLRKE